MLLRSETGRRCSLRFLRRLQQEHSPVGRPQVEDVRPLAVISCSHGQRVMDGHGVLHVLLRQVSLGAVLVLSEYSNSLKNRERNCIKTLKIFTTLDSLHGIKNTEVFNVCFYMWKRIVQTVLTTEMVSDLN